MNSYEQAKQIAAEMESRIAGQDPGAEIARLGDRLFVMVGRTVTECELYGDIPEEVERIQRAHVRADTLRATSEALAAIAELYRTIREERFLRALG